MNGTYKLASVLLQYPSAAHFAGLDELERCARLVRRKSSREPLLRFIGWLREAGPTEVAQHYVQTFDLRRRCALYLTYFRYGDTRERGMAMLVIKAAYRDAGFQPSTDELPDYLPMVLDFAALCPRGERLLHSHRIDLELLRRGLAKNDSPYADVVVAIAAQLPGLGRREIDKVQAAWRSGPPRDEVGLEFGGYGTDAFAPPEYLSGAAGIAAGIGAAP